MSKFTDFQNRSSGELDGNHFFTGYREVSPGVFSAIRSNLNSILGWLSGSFQMATLEPYVAFVSTTGDDSEAVIGRSDKPFLTVQAAADAIEAAPAGSYAMKLSAGEFGSMTIGSAAASKLKFISGQGAGLSSIASIIANGVPGDDGDSSSTNGVSGTSGIDLNISSDGTVRVFLIESNGGAGGHGAVSADGETGGSGGYGGAGGNIRLENMFVDSIYADGGAGGNGEYGNTSIGLGGEGGSVGTIYIKDSKFDSLFHRPGGGGGGPMSGNEGSGTALFHVLSCHYNLIDNHFNQSSTASALRLNSYYVSAVGNAISTSGTSQITSL